MSYVNDISFSDDYIITIAQTTNDATESVGSTFYRYMKVNKNKMAQIDLKAERSETYQELLKRCIRTALHMKDKNINRDHVIALCTNNHLDALVPWIATQFLGAKMCTIDPIFSPKEISHLIAQVSPKMLFVIPDLVPIVENVVKDLSLDATIIVFGDSTIHSKFSEFLTYHPEEDVFQPVKIDNLKDTAFIFFTSGTTGQPKGICINHYSFVTQVLNSCSVFWQSELQILPPDVKFLHYNTLYWVGVGMSFLYSTVNSCCRLVPPVFDGAQIWVLIEKYKRMLICLTPFQVIEMLDKKPKNFKTTNVVYFNIVGSIISSVHILQLREALPNCQIRRVYGLTEATGQLTAEYDMSHTEKIGFVGKPVQGISLKVVDLDTNKNVGPYQNGELRVKTDFVMNGYYNADSTEAFDEDGWLRTGDIAYYDDNFNFYIVERYKETFKSKGWFMFTSILENELLNHPAVKQAVVIGVPKDKAHLDYLAMGLVVLKDGCDCTEEEIEKFVEKRMSNKSKLNGGVRFIETLPLTSTGKVNKTKLRDMVLKDMVDK